MSACPEAEFRESLSDPEFWDYVLLGKRPDQTREDWDAAGTYAPSYDEPGPLDVALDPCPVCGEFGPCGYDAEGRILIHLKPVEDDE